MVRCIVSQEKHVSMSVLVATSVAGQVDEKDNGGAIAVDVETSPAVETEASRFNPMSLTPEEAVMTVARVRILHGLGDGNTALKGRIAATHEAFKDAGEKFVNGEAIDLEALNKHVQAKDTQLVTSIDEAREIAERFFWEGNLQNLSRQLYPQMMGLLQGTEGMSTEENDAIIKLLRDDELRRFLSPQMRQLMAYFGAAAQSRRELDAGEEEVEASSSASAETEEVVTAPAA